MPILGVYICICFPRTVRHSTCGPKYCAEVGISTETWWLVASLMFLSSIEWICFVLLNHGLPLLEDLSGGQEALAGIFQSVAVRSSGFAIVSMNSIAPGLQFLYVIMMYVAIYPIAMAVRSTNS